jgi:sec-independent protein translocase protein TatB
MSGVGFWELILVFLIGLIVLGPERLPRVASQLGSWLGQARRMTRVMKRQLEEELDLEKELKIRPEQQRSSLPPPSSTPRPDDKEEKPDTWSPAHDAGAVGTGVGDPGHGSTAEETGDEHRGDATGQPPHEAPSQEKAT